MSSRDRVRRLIRRGRPRGLSPEARAELDAALAELADVAIAIHASGGPREIAELDAALERIEDDLRRDQPRRGPPQAGLSAP
jgi:hypothetical protein